MSISEMLKYFQFMQIHNLDTEFDMRDCKDNVMFVIKQYSYELFGGYSVNSIKMVKIK